MGLELDNDVILIERADWQDAATSPPQELTRAAGVRGIRTFVVETHAAPANTPDELAEVAGPRQLFDLHVRGQRHGDIRAHAIVYPDGTVAVGRDTANYIGADANDDRYIALVVLPIVEDRTGPPPEQAVIEPTDAEKAAAAEAGEAEPEPKVVLGQWPTKTVFTEHAANGLAAVRYLVGVAVDNPNGLHDHAETAEFAVQVFVRSGYQPVEFDSFGPPPERYQERHDEAPGGPREQERAAEEERQRAEQEAAAAEAEAEAQVQAEADRAAADEAAAAESAAAAAEAEGDTEQQR